MSIRVEIDTFEWRRDPRPDRLHLRPIFESAHLSARSSPHDPRVVHTSADPLIPGSGERDPRIVGYRGRWAADKLLSRPMEIPHEKNPVHSRSLHRPVEHPGRGETVRHPGPRERDTGSRSGPPNPSRRRRLAIARDIAVGGPRPDSKSRNPRSPGGRAGRGETATVAGCAR